MNEQEKVEFEIEANMLACVHSLEDLKHFMENGNFMQESELCKSLNERATKELVQRAIDNYELKENKDSRCDAMATNILGAVINHLRETGNAQKVDMIFANDGEQYHKMYSDYYDELYKNETRFDELLNIELDKVAQ